MNRSNFYTQDCFKFPKPDHESLSVMRRSPTPAQAAIYCLALTSLLLAGCGTKTQPVSGTVTYDGRPIVSGAVSLIPIGGMPVAPTSAEIKDGRFSIPKKFGIMPGNYRIGISAINPDKPMTAASHDGVGEMAPLFPPFSTDHAFSGPPPFVFDFDVPKKSGKR